MHQENMGGGALLACLLLVLFNFATFSVQVEAKDDFEFLALVSDWMNKPSNWIGTNPCADGWVGIRCNGSYIVNIELSSMGLKGSLTGDIKALTELQTLDLSYNTEMVGTLPSSIGSLTKLTSLILVGCGFFGEIPDLSGLQELHTLSLNLNKFSGRIPPSIGSLSKLYWLDLADNMLSGDIPISSGSTPGLDKLINTKHFHFGNNKISGSLPPKLFSSQMKMIHLLFDNNALEGSIPSTLGLVKSLEVVRLDRNGFSGSVPDNINNLTNVEQLYLSNNKLTGPLPDLTGMNKLSYVDLSNNTFERTSVPAWFSSLVSLTTMVLESLRISGQLPPDMFSIPQLETVRLMKNFFNGTLNITDNFSKQLQLVDLRFNRIEYIVEGINYERDVLLQNNPFCDQAGGSKYCMSNEVQLAPSYKTPVNCIAKTCSSNEDLSPRCSCAYPYIGTLYFRAPAFSNLGNSSHYQALENKLSTVIGPLISLDSVSLYDIAWYPDKYLQIGLKVYPSNGTRFTRSDIIILGFVLSNQTFKPPHEFGPFFFRGSSYKYFADEAVTSSSKLKTLPIIIGASAGAGALVLAVIIIVLAMYGCKQSRRAHAAEIRNEPFAGWDGAKDSGRSPQLKGARCFTFGEMKLCTDNFSDSNLIGSGGYGNVYRGTLGGELVAIKRAQMKSMQGHNEFKTEIELLSRVHHKNLVRLVGFCFDKREQMLVYEYIPNGSLSDNLTGKSRVKLDWLTRLKVALGSARGLAYLHELADPPIVHRDIKSSNILLDNQLVAKVADFGLCKCLGDGAKTHVTTQVKGTMGYLDPEYYMTQQVTEKSDVYSFGILLLELVTARKPIERGRHIVREVKTIMNRSEGNLYGLQAFIDPNLTSSGNLLGFQKLVDLALWCVSEEGAKRPCMGEVVKEIEEIFKSVGLNPNADSAPQSTSYAESSNHGLHPYSNEGFASFGGSLPIAR